MSVFVATGTRRMPMREAVLENYAAVARSGASCGCGSPASAERNHITNVELRQGYAEEMPVADGEVDVIISNCVINLTFAR